MSLNKTTLNTGLVLGVLALAIGSWLLLRDGRYQRTDNAYVNADFTVVAPKVAGFVSSVEVDDNQPVKAGDVLIVLEAMKMENEISAPQDGTIASIDVRKGDVVDSGALLCTMN